MLRNFEIMGDEQSEKLRKQIDESLASLNHQIQSKLDKLCTDRQDDVTEILEKHQQQTQQFCEDQTDIVTKKIRSEMTELLDKHKQESMRVLRKETDAMKRQFVEVVKKQQAENKTKLNNYANAQLEAKVRHQVIIVMLLVIILLLIYTPFNA